MPPPIRLAFLLTSQLPFALVYPLSLNFFASLFRHRFQPNRPQFLVTFYLQNLWFGLEWILYFDRHLLNLLGRVFLRGLLLNLLVHRCDQDLRPPFWLILWFLILKNAFVKCSMLIVLPQSGSDFQHLTISYLFPLLFQVHCLVLFLIKLNLFLKLIIIIYCIL